MSGIRCKKESCKLGCLYGASVEIRFPEITVIKMKRVIQGQVVVTKVVIVAVAVQVVSLETVEAVVPQVQVVVTTKVVIVAAAVQVVSLEIVAAVVHHGSR